MQGTHRTIDRVCVCVGGGGRGGWLLAQVLILAASKRSESLETRGRECAQGGGGTCEFPLSHVVST